jgi:hypothetical protein
MPSIRSKIVIQLAHIVFSANIGWQIVIPVSASSLPPDPDIPEEVLRAEIITEARSPIDGKALSAVEFAELVVKAKQLLDLDDASIATSSPKFKETLLLIRLRGFLRSVGIPIK